MGTYGGEADERIDAHGGILLPGFVNTHCHASMVPFRTMGDDCPDRLRRFLFPLENEAMTRELTYRGAVFGIGEMLLAGTTTFVDMYYFEDEVARACVETGMRGYLGETLISQPDLRQPLCRAAESTSRVRCLNAGKARSLLSRLSRRMERRPAMSSFYGRQASWRRKRRRFSRCMRAKWITR